MNVTGDPGNNFFDQNPEVKYIPEFQKLIKDEGKERASEVLWALYLTTDPKSDWATMSIDERRQLADETYLSEPIDWEKYKYLVNIYESLILTRAEYIFNVWERKAEQMTSYLDQLEFGTDDDKTILTLFKQADEIWDKLEKVRESFNKEREKLSKATRGDVESGGLQDLKQNASRAKKI